MASLIIIAISLAPMAHAVPLSKGVFARDTCPATYTPYQTVDTSDTTSGLTYPIVAVYSYAGITATISNQSLYDCANDSSVVFATENADVTIEDSYIYKSGYFTSLNEASFYGVNSALLAGNGSTLTITGTTIESYIGGGGIYCYGAYLNDTYVYVSDTSIWSNASVSHSLYASATGYIYAHNISSTTYGYRSSSFSGDTGSGYITVTDSTSHTYGTGSAVFYVLGTTTATRVTGVTENAPVMFMDGLQYAYIYDSTLTAGGPLGGMVIFSSSTTSYGYVTMNNTVFTTVGSSIPSIYVCNTVATVHLTGVTMTAESGNLIVANNSGIPQSFDQYTDPTDTSKASTAIIYNYGNTISGNVVALNGSTVDWYLSDSSVWSGAANPSGATDAAANVYIDANSTWILSADSYVQILSAAAIDSIQGNYTLYYNATANAWLQGQSTDMTTGGVITPWVF